MAKLLDLTGQKFGRLTVIERKENSKNGTARWLCKCECGNYVVVLSSMLKSGRTKSCGCYMRETISNIRKKHGMADTRLYKVWRTMKERCFCKTYRDYKHYGGRGITVCDSWKNDFKSFYDWAIANGYDENAKRGQYTIDRIDVNGNYEPSNCRLVSMKEQANNIRTNHRITYKGKTQTLSQWADEVGISSHTLSNRLNIGWSIEKTLNTKIKGE